MKTYPLQSYGPRQLSINVSIKVPVNHQWGPQCLNQTVPWDYLLIQFFWLRTLCLSLTRGYNLCYRIHNWAEFRVITSSKRICIEIWIPREQKNISKSSLRIWLMTNVKIWVIWAVWSQWQCRENDGSDYHLFYINNIPARNKEYLAVKATDLNNLTFCVFVHHK